MCWTYIIHKIQIISKWSTFVLIPHIYWHWQTIFMFDHWKEQPGSNKKQCCSYPNQTNCVCTIGLNISIYLIYKPLKEQFTQKWTFAENVFTIGWVCFFIRFGEMCLCISVSAINALQWMGAVRMRVQTADKNITMIHTTPVHQLMSWEDKRNKSIITENTILVRFP